MLALLGREIEHLDTRTGRNRGEADRRCTRPIRSASCWPPSPASVVIIALTLAIEIDPAAFKSGRHLAAWIGLTPKEHSTGGKQRMGGISRAGNERLRRLLVTGATAVIRCRHRPGNKQTTEWLLRLLARKPRKVVAVALANKMARMVWAMMTSGEVYRRQPSGAAVA